MHASNYSRIQSRVRPVEDPASVSSSQSHAFTVYGASLQHREISSRLRFVAASSNMPSSVSSSSDDERNGQRVTKKTIVLNPGVTTHIQKETVTTEVREVHTADGKVVRTVRTVTTGGHGGDGLHADFEKGLLLSDRKISGNRSRSPSPPKEKQPSLFSKFFEKHDKNSAAKPKTRSRSPSPKNKKSGFFSKTTSKAKPRSRSPSPPSPKEKKNIFSSAIKPSSKASPNKKIQRSDDSSSDEDEDFAEECLKVHNNYRAKHGVPALKLSKQLCNYSKEWSVKIAKEDCMRHRNDHKYGENIFVSWSSNPSQKISGTAPVESWYKEIKDHKFGQEPRTLASGHFSQVVWKESRELGVAQCRSQSGKIYVVANYDPPGNFIGKFALNVPPPKY